MQQESGTLATASVNKRRRGASSTGKYYPEDTDDDDEAEHTVSGECCSLQALAMWL